MVTFQGVKFGEVYECVKCDSKVNEFRIKIDDEGDIISSVAWCEKCSEFVNWKRFETATFEDRGELEKLTGKDTFKVSMEDHP